MSSQEVDSVSAVAPPTTDRYVVVSDGHALVTWARRLETLGYPVAAYTTRPAYRTAYAHVLDVALAPRSDKPSAWGEVGDAVLSGSATLLTDSAKVMDAFAGAPAVYGVAARTGEREARPLGVAVWVDPVSLTGHTYCVVERGAWTGGRGPQVAGAAAFIGTPPRPVRSAVDDWVLKHAPEGWRGLAWVALRGDSDGLHPVGAEFGWPAVVHDLWLWRQVACGCAPVGLTIADTGRAYVGVPVTLPPWPHYPRQANVPAPVHPVSLGTAAGHFAFHDVDVREGQLYAGGSDGYVGVAVGTGVTLARAVREAQSVACAAGALPESQWRADAGLTALDVLTELDGAGLLSL